MFGKHDNRQQNRPMKRFLVTGSAGFIGFHVAKRLLREGNQVTGLDNLNTYYDVHLKRARLAQLRGRRGFRFVMADVAGRAQMERLFQEEPFDCAVENHNLRLFIGFDRRDDLVELRDCFRPKNIERRMVERHAPVRRQTSFKADLCGRKCLLGAVHGALH